jgi:hypothetical protein
LNRRAEYLEARAQDLNIKVGQLERNLWMRKDDEENHAAFPENPSFLSDISESVFLNVFGAQKSIPRNEFRQPM